MHPELQEEVEQRALRNATRDPLSDVNRAMPYSDDAEKGVLSCLLQNPGDLMDHFLIVVEPEKLFYHPVNRQLFEEMAAFIRRPDRRMLDLVTFSQHLLDKGLMDKLGGPAFLAELLSFVPTPAHYPYYLGILKDKAKLRGVITVATNAIQQSYVYQETPGEVVDMLQRDALNLTMSEQSRGPVVFKTSVAEAVDHISFMSSNIGSVSGYETGLADIDRMLNGLESQDRIVIGARPSDGKTSLLMNIAMSLSFRQNIPGLIFSLDGKGMRLAMRSLAAESGVSMAKFRMGLRGKEDLRKFADTAKQLADIPLWIDDRSGLTIYQIESTARRLAKSHGIAWIAVDYFQLISCPTKRQEDPRVELGRVSTGLMDLAQDLNLPLLILAQLNRKAEERDRPRMMHLKECGQLEQDATKVVLLSRDTREWEKIREDEDIDEVDRKNAPHPMIDEKFIVADVAKNKDGPTGPTWLRFNGPLTKFGSFVPGKKLYESSHNKDVRQARHQEEQEPSPFE